MSSTANAVNGMPSASRADLKGSTAGWDDGSSTSSGPSGSCGDTTVSQRTSPPMGMSAFFSKPRTSV